MTTPIRQAAQAVIDRFESVRHTSTITPQVIESQVLELSNALDAEQAQAVEPVAWKWEVLPDAPIRNHKGEKSGVYLSNPKDSGIDIECAASIKNYKWTLLFTHPSQLPAGERAKVGDSRFESWYSELQQEDKSRKQIARAAYEAGMNEAQQAAVPAWTATADKMPKPCKNVLAYNGKKQPIRSMWVPAKTLEASGDGDFGEYDEVTDEMWWPEGWYETNAYEETHWLVDGQVTHWLPLPLPPQGDKP